MSDRMELETKIGLAEPDGYAGRISAVALSLAVAADELRQAAERMRCAEQEAREADLRVNEAQEQAEEAEARARGAEERLAEGERTNAELMELLQGARLQQREAGGRADAAEQRLHLAIQRTRELDEQIHEMEARLEEAENRPPVTVVIDQERSALQQAVAGEIRRPLTSILGLTLAIKHHDPASPEGKDMVRQLAMYTRKLDRLVTTFLELDRLVDGRVAPSRRRTDIEALVRRVAEETPDLANREVAIQASHVVTAVDPTLTEQMLEILLANAGRRTTPGTAVWVKVSPESSGVVVAVDDTGPEIPPDLYAALFESLPEKGPGGQRPGGPSGLALLSRLAEIHGGRAWVEQRAGGGASFRVFLPDVSEDGGAAVQEERVNVARVPEQEAGDEALAI